MLSMLELPACMLGWRQAAAVLSFLSQLLHLSHTHKPPHAGHRWANPSVRQLVRLMKHVVAHRQEAAARGLAARRRMASRYSPDAVAEVVAQQLRRIEIGLAAGQR